MRALATIAALAGLAAALAGCASTPGESLGRSPQSRLGRDVAEIQCARCHAIGARGLSPYATAPNFGDIRKRYAGVSLERELETITQVGHYEMPPTKISAEDRKNLGAYIERLGDR